MGKSEIETEWVSQDRNRVKIQNTDIKEGWRWSKSWVRSHPIPHSPTWGEGLISPTCLISASYSNAGKPRKDAEREWIWSRTQQSNSFDFPAEKKRQLHHSTSLGQIKDKPATVDQKGFEPKVSSLEQESWDTTFRYQLVLRSVCVVRFYSLMWDETIRQYWIDLLIYCIQEKTLYRHVCDVLKAFLSHSLYSSCCAHCKPLLPLAGESNYNVLDPIYPSEWQRRVVGRKYCRLWGIEFLKQRITFPFSPPFPYSCQSIGDIPINHTTESTAASHKSRR